MKASEQLDQVAAALAKAQGEMTHASFDAVNPAFKSKYATLSSVIDAIRAALASNGIAWMQSIVNTENGICAITRLIHSSGQWIESVGPEVPLDKRNAHGVASATTYAKRFGLSLAVGIAADTDDDGNAAAHNSPPARAVKVSAETQRWLKAIDEADASALSDIGQELVKTDVSDGEKGLLRDAFARRRASIARQ